MLVRYKSNQELQIKLITNMKSGSDKDTLSFLDKYSIHEKNAGSEDTILKDKTTGGLVLMREVVVQDKDNFKQIVETLESQKDLKHNHLLYLLQYHIKGVQEDSTSYHKIITFYEYSSHSLMEELLARTKQGRPFEESQLWNILCSAVLGLSYLQRENIGHGSVSLLDMYITPEGLIKIVDPSIASASPFNFMQGYYYSPEILRYYASNDQYDAINIFKSDVFSLAVCIMQTALLESVEDSIDYDNFEINFDILQSKLQLIGQNYSQDFVSVLAEMLGEEPVDRPDMIALEERLMMLLDQQDGVKSSINFAPQVELLDSTVPDVQDFTPPREGFPDANSLDKVSFPDQALYVPTTNLSEQNQTNRCNQRIILQSSVRSRQDLEKAVTLQETFTVQGKTVLPNKQGQFSNARRPSEDVTIKVTPASSGPNDVRRPSSNYQAGSTLYQQYIKDTLHQQSQPKYPEYVTNQGATIQTTNRASSKQWQHQFVSSTQHSTYGQPIQLQTQKYMVSQYPTPHNPLQNSNFKKKSMVMNPGPSTGIVTKVSYGLGQLAPLQSQSIQVNTAGEIGKTAGNAYVGQPIHANTKLAPMITSNAVSKQNANLFTDPKLLSMMRADLKKYEVRNYNHNYNYVKDTLDYHRTQQYRY